MSDSRLAVEEILDHKTGTKGYKWIPLSGFDFIGIRPGTEGEPEIADIMLTSSLAVDDHPFETELDREQLIPLVRALLDLLE